MRLDHLLSKEQSKAEMQRIHPMVDTEESMKPSKRELKGKESKTPSIRATKGWIKHGNKVAEQAEFPRGRSVDAQRRIGSC